MPDPEVLRQAIIERLSRVIDPETGVDVVYIRCAILAINIHH